MTLIKSKEIIDNNESISLIIEKIYKKQIIAIDTEFTREKTYYPILSLIQIAVDGNLYAIDCLSKIDLAPIFNVINDVNIKKILHSCSQDLQIFFNKSGVRPQNIEDVQVMANFCGMGFNPGYSNLVEKLLNIEIDKKMQKSNWQKRPLDIKQIEYALLDVAYIEEIHKVFSESLTLNKKVKWFEEEMQNFIDKSVADNIDNLVNNFTFHSRSYNRELRKIMVRNIIYWREETARKIDLPRQHLLADNYIEKIVSDNNYLNIDFLKDIIDDHLISELENIIINSQNDFSKQKNTELENQSQELCDEFRRNESPVYIMNEEQKDCYKKAKYLILRIAKEENFKEQFLINSSSLKQIILRNKSVKDLVSGWRYYLFGTKLEKLIY